MDKPVKKRIMASVLALVTVLTLTCTALATSPAVSTDEAVYVNLDYYGALADMDKLKSLTRFRDSLIRQRSRQLVELTNVLDKIFPEFKSFFKGRFSVTAMYILANYSTPEKISNMNSRSYDALRRLSRGKFTMSSFVQLKMLARDSVGHCNDYLLHEMGVLLDIYNQMDSRIQELDEQITACIKGIDPPILSIPGIGALSAAVILSEYGDMALCSAPQFISALQNGQFILI